MAGFPHVTQFLKRPIGWKKKGKVRSDHVWKKESKTYEDIIAGCPKCWDHLRVGIENDKAFLYCQRCMEKVTKPYY